jgi:mono/diheme cytochrome c family protein
MKKFILALALLAPSTVLADGASDFAAMCSACHGATGAGDGAAAAALPVTPANFTDAAFWATRTDESVANVIKNGGASVGKSPLMAPFGAALDDARIAEIVTYIRTLSQ